MRERRSLRGGGGMLGEGKGDFKPRKESSGFEKNEKIP